MVGGRWLSVLVATVALASTPSLARADDEIPDEARRHFRAGVAFLQDPDGERAEEAYAEFKLAYALSKSPKVLGNLALCAMKLERDGEAIEAYTRYAMEVSDIDAAERRQVNQDIATLTASSVKVTLKVDKAQTSFLDTRTPVRGGPITNAYGPTDGTLEIVVRVGHHRIRARSGNAEAEWEFDATGGVPLTHDFHLTPPPDPNPPPPIFDVPATRSAPSKVGPLTTMGIGGAMLLAGTITGFVALHRINELEKACPNDVCPPEFDYARATADTRPVITATDVLLITGGIVTAGGLAWLLLNTSGGRAPSRSASASCTATGCGAWLRFGFQ